MPCFFLKCVTWKYEKGLGQGCKPACERIWPAARAASSPHKTAYSSGRGQAPVLSRLSSYLGVSRHLLLGDHSTLCHLPQSSSGEEKKRLLFRCQHIRSCKRRRTDAGRAAAPCCWGAGCVSRCWSLQTEIAPCTASFPGNPWGRGVGSSRARCRHVDPVGSSASAALSLEEAHSHGEVIAAGEKGAGNCGVAPSPQIKSVCVEQGPLWVWCKTAWDWTTDGPLMCWCHAAWARGDQLAQGVSCAGPQPHRKGCPRAGTGCSCPGTAWLP